MLKYYKKCKGWAISWAVMEPIVAASSFFVTLLLQYIVAIATGENGKTIADGVFWSVAVVLYSVVTSLLFYYCKEHFRCRVTEEMKNDIFAHIMGKKFSEYYKTNTGEYLSVINNDVKLLEETATQPVFTSIQDISLLLVSLGYMCYVNFSLAVIMLVIALASLLLPRLYSLGLSAASEVYMKKTAEYNRKIKDAFSGFEVIRNVGILRTMQNRQNNWNHELEQSRYQNNIKLDRAGTMTQMTRILVQLLLAVACAFFALKGTLTISQLVLAIQMQGNIVSPLFSIVENLNQYRSSAAIRKKIQEITAEDLTDDLPSASPLEQEICFRDVEFGYEGNRKILQGMNLTFEKGKKYAVIGVSGSGKSTILRLLLRYYDGYSGQITMDGTEISSLSAESLRCQFSLIPQNVFLFDDTLYNNLTLYRDYPEEQVWEAVCRAGLETVISRLEDGLETHVSENGNNFSGGEKQRISVARALLLGNNVIIMDEATANVDVVTAAGIERIILEDEALTCIAVMHHIVEDNMDKYDEILVIKDGVVAEKGSYQALLRKQGLFCQLQKNATEG